MRVFKYYDKQHRNRIGNCDFIPSNGDYCLRIRKSGDNFHYYIAFRKTKKGNFKKVGEFGAYSFGKEIKRYAVMRRGDKYFIKK